MQDRKWQFFQIQTMPRFFISMDNCPEEACDIKIFNMVGTEI
jgi:hypothetical protein